MAWVGLTLVTLAQAFRAQPLLAPDAVTLGSIAVVLAAALAIWFAPLGEGYRGRSARPRAVSTG